MNIIATATQEKYKRLRKIRESLAEEISDDLRNAGFSQKYKVTIKMSEQKLSDSEGTESKEVLK